jgi:hypothetical protein
MYRYPHALSKRGSFWLNLVLFGNANIAPSMKVTETCAFFCMSVSVRAVRVKISLTSETKNFLFGALSKRGSIWLSLTQFALFGNVNIAPSLRFFF